MRPRTLVVTAGCALSAATAHAQFLNADFENGTLSDWVVRNTAGGTGAPGTVVSVDIDGPGPLGPSLAAHFMVGRSSSTQTGEQGIEMVQSMSLNGGQLYTFEFDWAALRDGTTTNAQGGVFSLIVDGVALATQAAGSTSSTAPHYGHISVPFTPPVSGTYEVGARITRPFTVPADLHQYVDNFRPAAGGGPTGACCLPSGACVVASSAGCAAQGGIYRGDNTTCPANCPQPTTGACCFFNSCSVLTQAQCAAQNGVYRGDNVTCAQANCPLPPPVIAGNCNLSTGPTTLSGVPAPAGEEWSECARDATDPFTANTTAGYAGSGAFRLADDFVVPAGGMNIAYIRFPVYTTGATTVTTTALTLQILNGPPGVGTPVFGDQTTNRLANAEFSRYYRIFNTVAPVAGCTGTGTAPGTTRHIQWAYAAVNQMLPAGTYWLDWNYAGGTFSPPSTIQTAIGRQCDPNNANGMQFNAAWAPITDAGQGCVPTPVAQDLYFEILGSTGSTCYPDCNGDHALNVNDFICFQGAFAANNVPVADCDHSTTLNVNDFVCFQSAFAAGCSQL